MHAELQQSVLISRLFEVIGAQSCSGGWEVDTGVAGRWGCLSNNNVSTCTVSQQLNLKCVFDGGGMGC